MRWIQANEKLENPRQYEDTTKKNLFIFKQVVVCKADEMVFLHGGMLNS